METEKQIEDLLVKQIRKHNGLCYKWTSPGNIGVPDRIVILDGRLVFVELKAPGKKPRTAQRVAARRIRKSGGRVYCISTKEQVMQFVHDLKRGYPKEKDYDEI